jgi:uncharacterized protein (DUF58 family)
MKWFVGALLLLLAALLLESSLLAYAMYVLLALLLLSRWLARSWIGSLSATRTCKQLSAEIGERVRVELTITNTGGLPVPWLLAEDLLPQYALGKRFPRLKIKGKRLQIAMLRSGATLEMKYQIECLMRGYYQIGPLTLESGDLFGLHRRFRVLTEPTFLLVYPRIVPLLGYDIASRRPIGDVRLTHRLYEDPTRIAGVRPYEAGDPLNRVHWRATARTGALHSKIHEPSTLSGATVLLDFHQAGYHQQGEPFRSELAVTTAISLANAVYEMGQQIGLATNGRDAADRVGWRTGSVSCRMGANPAAYAASSPPYSHDPRTRTDARATAAMREDNERLQPLLVETRRGVEQLQRIREMLARVELTDGLSFAELVSETISRLPRDATILAVLPEVPVETAIALGNLRRAGLAVAVVLILGEDAPLERAYGRLVSEGIRDIRHLKSEEELPELCRRQVDRSSPYTFIVT